jgi:hypothetical protein
MKAATARLWAVLCVVPRRTVKAAPHDAFERIAALGLESVAPPAAGKAGSSRDRVAAAYQDMRDGEAAAYHWKPMRSS